MRVYDKAIDSYKGMNPQAKASLWFLFANVFQKAVMIIFTPIFTRVMTTEEFSKYAVFQSWEAIFTVFATLNISSYATAKALVDIKENKDEFILSAEILTYLLTLVTFVIYMFLRLGFGKFDDLPVPVMISLFCDIVFVATYNFWSQNERYHLRYRALVVTSLIIGVLSPVFAFVLIYYSEQIGLYKGWTRIISIVCINGLIGVFLFMNSLKMSKYNLTTRYWGYCLKYCIPLIPHFLAAAFLQKASQLFVDNYSGSHASGVFSLANSLALMMMVFNDALTKTLVPWTYKKLSEKKYQEIHNPIFGSLIIIGILNILMCLVAPEIVVIFADSEYYDAIYAIPPLVGVCFFGFLYNAYTNIEYYYQETLFVSAASIIAGITIVILEIVTVPRYGFLAAAYSALLSYVVYALTHYIFMKKTIEKHIPGTIVYKNSMILCVSMVYVVMLLVMPILYKLRYIRYIILMIIFAGIIICAKPLARFMRYIMNKS